MAKSGKKDEAEKEVILMALTITLYDLPNTLRQGLSLVKAMLLEDPGALPKTINAGKKHLAVVSSQVEGAVDDFIKTHKHPTPDDLVDMRKKLNDILSST